MLDVRGVKTKPRSPDFQCPDAQCVNEKGFRTGVWLPKGNGPTMPVVAPSSPVAPSAPPIPREMFATGRDTLIQELFWDSFDGVLTGIAKRKLTDLFKPENICSLSATLFIQRSNALYSAEQWVSEDLSDFPKAL